MSTNLVDAIIAADAYEALTWRPNKPNDIVAGKCVFCDHIETKNGKKLLIKILADKVISDGEELNPTIVAVWERAAIRQIAEEQRLRVGDEVAFRFIEEVPTSAGGKKKLFAGIVRRTEDSEEWSVGATASRGSKSFDDGVPFDEPD